ncbi:MAG: 1-acyl-sn-glycerol-3-phosphate acyltransferase [Clostridia bacterium]|nr:1-acyl-sn-glycerol-3-phosphate acyltransferase [Clostridia bacterium]
MKNNQNKSKFYRVMYALFAGIVKVLFGIKVINAENEPEAGGYLICSNHVSASDAVVICYAFKKNQAHFMAKKELFKIPLLSGLIRLLGAFPVDRGGSDVGAIKKAISMIKDGTSVAMFPQGHRHPGVDPRNTPVKNGAGLICTRAECGVVPVYVLRKKNTFRLFKRTYVIIGEKIEKATLETLGDNAAITEYIFDKICTLGENTARELGVKL